MHSRTKTGDHLVALALALLCGFIVQAPHLLLNRAFVNLDFTVHYNYARETVVSMQAGDFWPHYAFMAQRGLGEPGLLYYSPLYYMASWALFPLTGNVWAAMQLVEILSAGALGYFSWRLAAAYAGPRGALPAIPLAVIAPMACMLQLGFNGYPWACALAPLAALAWAVLRPEAQWRLVNLPAILALAVTVFTHTVSGLMAVIMLGGVSLAALLQHRTAALRQPGFWSPVLTVVAGLMLSSAYLLPAYGSQGLIDSSVWRENYTPFNAFSLSTVTAWAFGIRWFAFQWPVSLAAFLLAGLSLWSLRGTVRSRADKQFLLSAGVIAAVVLVLASELSYPLWLVNTPLRNIQFPHRLISILVPLAAVLATVAWARSNSTVLRLSIGVVALVSLGMSGLVILKAALRDGTVIDASESSFPPYAGLDEYRTKAAAERGNRGNDFDFARECADHGVQCAPGVRQGRGMVWQLTSQQAGTLRLPVYCFPAWALTVNGKPAEARCDREKAIVQASLPAGVASVSLQWQALPLERLGMAISLVMALLLALAGFLRRRLP